MKTFFELNIDTDGCPCIKFRHYEKDNSLEQNLIKAFIYEAQTNGLYLRFSRGFMESGTDNSWSEYEITIKNRIR